MCSTRILFCILEISVHTHGGIARPLAMPVHWAGKPFNHATHIHMPNFIWTPMMCMHHYVYLHYCMQDDYKQISTRIFIYKAEINRGDQPR